MRSKHLGRSVARQWERTGAVATSYAYLVSNLKGIGMRHRSAAGKDEEMASTERATAATPLPEELDLLVSLAAGGDGAAFARVMRRHNRLMYRTARSLLRDDGESEEAVQDAYLNAWHALPQFRGESRLPTWLVRIVMNQAMSRLRRRSGVVLPFSSLDLPDGGQEELDMRTTSPQSQEPLQAVQRAEFRKLIERHIDKLPEQFRTVFVLRALEEWSIEEVAQLLQVPEATVRTRFFRARAQLREALARDIDFAMEDIFAFDGERCDRIVAAVLLLIKPH